MAKRPYRRKHGARQYALHASWGYRAALDAIALMRRNLNMTLERAAELSGTTVSNVTRQARPALTFKRGRWYAKPHDTLPRRMRFLTPRGYISVLTTDSRDATLIANHHNAVRAYLKTENQRGLKAFENLYFATDEQEYDFVTDPRTILRVARAGEISFLDIYADEGL